MSEYKEVSKTGKSDRIFGTGSVRDSSEGKGRQDLIPTYPLHRLAVHYENGAKKYGDRNWELGQPVNEYYCSAFRHLTAWLSGDDSEDHLSAGVWNLFGMIDTLDKIEKGDLPEILLDALPSNIKGRFMSDVKAEVEVEYESPVATEKNEDGIYICNCTSCTNSRAKRKIGDGNNESF